MTLFRHTQISLFIIRMAYFSCPPNRGLFLHPSKISAAAPSKPSFISENNTVSLAATAPNPKSSSPRADPSAARKVTTAAAARKKESSTPLEAPPPISEGKSVQADLTKEYFVNEIGRYKKRLDSAEKNLEKVTSELLTSMEAQSSLSSENSALRSSILEKEIVIKRFNENNSSIVIDQLKKQIAELNSEKEVISKRLEVLDEEYGDELNYLRGQVSKHNHKENVASKDTEQLKLRINELELELSMLKAENSVTKDISNSDMYLSLKAERDQAFENLAILNEEHKSLVSKHERVSGKFRPYAYYNGSHFCL